MLFLVACSSSGMIHNKELEGAIEAKLAEAATTEINLKELTDFNWEKAYIFYPYSSDSMIETQVGFSIDNARSISHRDDINLLVLVAKDQKVYYAEISRQHGDLLSEEEDGYTPTNATIKIQPKEGG
ncbi:hypothetical protein [Alkalihalobacillus sp. TS-13]|uniref:hypothetical protein n=1 Tax=Alkalihalobacillus sp. TS-13 TaxID=2842455 RepID=UPI001C86BC8F|nr:hypothetical protein [Alkalihalobacillus sp. TS-13]